MRATVTLIDIRPNPMHTGGPGGHRTYTIERGNKRCCCVVLDGYVYDYSGAPSDFDPLFVRTRAAKSGWLLNRLAKMPTTPGECAEVEV